MAVHFAHDQSTRFPDGVLYLDLAGTSRGATPVSPPAVLTALLRELGAPATGWTDTVGAARAYRTRLRGRRMLVVLDNATNASQVLPAIPEEPGCAAIVTSRRPIPGPDGAVHLFVDPLSTSDSVALLGRIAGARRIGQEPDAAAELAQLCGNLPLALRVVATRTATRPHWPLRSWVELLANEDRRLDELSTPDLNVRAVLLTSVEALAASGREADRDAVALLPHLPALPPTCDPTTVAALTGWPTARAEHALDAREVP